VRTDKPDAVAGPPRLRLDRFDRDLLAFVLSWRRYGGPPEAECLVEFGLNRDQVHERCMELVCRCHPNAYRDADERTLLLRVGGMLLPDRASRVSSATTDPRPR
jgi:hypothetical protein